MSELNFSLSFCTTFNLEIGGNAYLLLLTKKRCWAAICLLITTMAKTIAGNQTVKFGLLKKSGANIEVGEGTLNELMNGRSKFVNGRQLTVTGWDYAYVQPKDGGEPAVNTRVFPVLTTDIDDETNIWLSSYQNPKLDVDNKDVIADGTADDLIRKLLTKNGDINRKEALDEIAEALKGKTLIVRRKRYVGRIFPENAPSYTKVLSIPCFDFVK